MEFILVVVVAVLVIAGTTAIAPRLNVAGPLILVAIGIVVGLLPFLDVPQIDPEWILAGVLPPLLYAAAVRLPAVEFRRSLASISGLAFILVVASSVLLGLLFFFTIPGISPAIAVALGAILSPTDAVATSIAKRLGAPDRVLVILEGESLLNDATALVLLRSMIAAASLGAAAAGIDGAGVAFLISFGWGLLVAIVVGALVGWVNLGVRRLLTVPAANTAVSFTVPFIAYVPTEHFGGSGLVAAVIAGIVTATGSAKWFTPEQRQSDKTNWQTVELLLEGAVFLLMGLQLKDIVTENIEGDSGLGAGVALAATAFAVLLLVRAAYVAILVLWQGKRARNRREVDFDAISSRIDAIADSIADGTYQRGRSALKDTRRTNRPVDSKRATRRVGMLRRRVEIGRNDWQYYEASPIEWKHGALIVWAGMRGAVTVAAAQTLPADTTARSLLIFVAFAVAVASLMIQGFTLPWVVRALRFPSEPAGAAQAEDDEIDAELRQALSDALEENAHALARLDGTPFPEIVLERARARAAMPPDSEREITSRDMLELRLAMSAVMRRRLDELTSDGAYSTDALRHALAELDADEISTRLRLGED